MNIIDQIKSFLLFIGITASGFLLVIVVLVVFAIVYPKAKLILSDLIRFLGFTSKMVRKVKIELEIEGTINNIIYKLNHETRSDLYAECNVRWVTDKNVESLLEQGKAIVRVDFHGKSHDQNLYNCVYNYNKVAFLNKTKPFMVESVGEAVDQLMTKVMLDQAKRSAILVFNNEFQKLETAVKEYYFQLEDAYEKGLFQRLLVNELSLIGERICIKTPSIAIQQEISEFLDWFHDIVVREREEKSILQFTSSNIRVGIILVANDQTYERHGISAYLRRARKYASEAFDGIYLVSRGVRRGNIVKEIASELTSTGEFSRLISNPHTTRFDPERNELIQITCLPLKSEHANLIQFAWDKIEDAVSKNDTLKAIISEITMTDLTVNLEGLIVTIPCGRLSELSDIIPKYYFKIGEELEVKIEENNRSTEHLVLSNVGTSTDPKIQLERYKPFINKVCNATVKSIKTHNSNDIGLTLELDLQEGLIGFIDRKVLTYSRFILLSEKYKAGDRISVKIDSTDTKRNILNCTLTDPIQDPWANVSRYTIGTIQSVIIRELTARYILTEVEEGIEGLILATEVTWEEDVLGRIQTFVVGQRIRALIIGRNDRRKQLVMSLKKAIQSKEQALVERLNGEVIEVTIVTIERAFLIARAEGNEKVVIKIHDIDWCYVSNIDKHLRRGEVIQCRVMDYNSDYNEVVASIKDVEINNFDFFEAAKHTTVTGTVSKICNNSVLIDIEYREKMAKGILPASEIADAFFQPDMIQFYFPRGEKYTFQVKDYDQERKVIILSRKKYLASLKLEYGERYICRAFQLQRKVYVYGNKVEGILVTQYPESISNEPIYVIPARFSKPTEFTLDI